MPGKDAETDHNPWIGVEQVLPPACRTGRKTGVYYYRYNNYPISCDYFQRRFIHKAGLYIYCVLKQPQL